MSHAAVQALQRAVGNRAAASLVGRQAVVSRSTMPFLTWKSDEQLTKDALDGDLQAIKEISDYGSLSEANRLTMIDMMNGAADNWRDRRALRHLWEPFDLETVMANEANRRRFEASIGRAPDAMAELTQLAKLVEQFPADVRTVANATLSGNLALIRQQQVDLGLLTFDNGNQPSPMTDDVSAKMVAMKAAATAIAKQQVAQEGARKIVVGWDRAESTTDIAGRTIWAESRFDPLKAPDSEEQPPGPGTNPTQPHQPYATVKAQYGEATRNITGWLRNFPALYAIARTGDSADTSAFARNSTPAAARATIGRALDSLVSDIHGAQTKLKDDGPLDPLDLLPVHARMTAERSDAPHDWTTALGKFAAKRAVANHDLQRALGELGLELASQALFILAPFTGGASLLVALGGLGIQAATLGAADQRYDALAQAAKVAASPGTEIVDPGTVAFAQRVQESEEIALALSALCLGAEAVTGAVRALNGPGSAASTTAVSEAGGTKSVTLVSGPARPPIEVPVEVPGPMELQSNAADAAGWSARGVDPLAIEPPPPPSEPMIITGNTPAGAESSIVEGGPLPLESAEETSRRLGASYKRPTDAPKPLKFKRRRTDPRWLLTRQDELNWVQLDPDRNPRAEWRSAYRFEPPQGGGTVKFGPRTYIFDAAGNMTEASTTDLTLGIRDPVMYAGRPGVGGDADFGHLLGIDFGHIDAQLGRSGGFPQRASINRPMGAGPALWYQAERQALRDALGLKQSGRPFRVVAEARGYVDGVPAETRITVESEGSVVFQSNWIGAM
jgi:hypothetical protein